MEHLDSCPSNADFCTLDVYGISGILILYTWGKKQSFERHNNLTSCNIYFMNKFITSINACSLLVLCEGSLYSMDLAEIWTP